ncbi:hypothetical protein XPA_007677 [Xanthoria parietina]
MSNDQNSDRDSEGSNEEEASSLLPHLDHGEQNMSRSNIGRPKIPSVQRHQSSISRQLPDGLPRKSRTPNRVRFQFEEHSNRESATSSPLAESDEEDYPPQDTSIGQPSQNAQRAPLLTGIEAPSVTVASSDLDLGAEHVLDIARPKSGMRSAFMNMANSIMYVSPPRPTSNRWVSTAHVVKEGLVS